MKTIIGIAMVCSAILSCTAPLGSSSGGAGSTSGLSDLKIETKSDICDGFVGSRQTDEICLFTIKLVPTNSSSTGTIKVDATPLLSEGPVVRNTIQIPRNKEYNGTMDVGWGDAVDGIRLKLYTTKNGSQRIVATNSSLSVTFALVDPTLDNSAPSNPFGGNNNPQPTPTPPDNSNNGTRPQLGNLDVTLVSQSETKKFSELFTEYAMVDISASWCGPCRSFAQSLTLGSQLMQSFKGGKCAFVTILADANDTATAFQSWITGVPAFAASHTYKVQGMSDPQIRSLFGNVSSYPSFRLISKTGQISNASPDSLPSNVTAACQ